MLIIKLGNLYNLIIFNEFSFNKLNFINKFIS